jgi:hypothetical protein
MYIARESTWKVGELIYRNMALFPPIKVVLCISLVQYTTPDRKFDNYVIS